MGNCRFSPGSSGVRSELFFCFSLVSISTKTIMGGHDFQVLDSIYSLFKEPQFVLFISFR